MLRQLRAHGTAAAASSQGLRARIPAQVPGTAAEFFTIMNRVLRYAALGPVKSLCHHRRVLFVPLQALMRPWCHVCAAVYLW